MSRDLCVADVYFSVLDSDSLKDVVAALEGAKGFLRTKVAAVLGLRRSAELRFHVDRSIEEGMRLDRIIEEANKPTD
jgi:ribosome-binding factor A